MRAKIGAIKGHRAAVRSLLTLFLRLVPSTCLSSMSLRTFLCDIIYEASDRIAVSGLYAAHLTTQVTQNRQRVHDDIETASNVDHDSQMDVDEQDNDDLNAVTFFGEAPRALQPLLKQNRRRHEFHASKSSPSSSILQVKAIRQKLNGACGYYSLFHSSMVRPPSDTVTETLFRRQSLHFLFRPPIDFLRGDTLSRFLIHFILLEHH